MTSDGERGKDPDLTGSDTFLRAVADSPPVVGDARVSLVTGQVVAGRFRLERRLGEGGMGVVWAARHVVTRKPVALKFLKDGARQHSETRQRFLREARAACAVRHPSVVEVHDVMELPDGSPVMVMDLLTGETLAARLEREHPLALAEVARIMVPVCSAVGCAHALGIVHRDLKPDNIFLVDDGDGRTEVKVLDFGIAKLTATEGDAARTGATTNTGALLGTPFYMAPEQIFGEKSVDYRADLWAIGVVLYEALAGQRPTQGTNLGQIIKVITRDGIVPLGLIAPTLPAPVVSLVGRLLQQDRDKRPADLHEVVAVLSTHTDVKAEPFDAPRGAVSSETLPRASTPVPIGSAEAYAPTIDVAATKRRRVRAVLMGATALCIIGGVGYSALHAPTPVASAPATPTMSATPGPTTAEPPVATATPAVSASAAASAEAAVTPTPALPTTTTAKRSPVAPPRPVPPQGSLSARPPPVPAPTATTPKMSEDL